MSYGFGSLDGSLANLAGVPSGSSGIQMGIALKMKYFLNKNIQKIFPDNKCKISEKSLEQLANLVAYNLKKRPESKFNRTFPVKAISSLENNKNNFMKVAEIEVGLYLHGRGFFDLTKT